MNHIMSDITTMADQVMYMKSLPQWCAWKRQEIDGKINKIPWNAEAHRGLGWSDIRNLSSYEEACAYRDEHQLDGIGIVTTEHDDLILIDLDNAFDDTGNLKPWALEWINLGGVAERSPSGTGVHIYARWSGPSLSMKRTFDGGRVEIYTDGRFFTVTEDWLEAAHDGMA